MDRSSKHFLRKEFSCKCGCGFQAVDYELLDVLEDLRAHYGMPILINSACRCEKHNKKVGGKSKSFHIKGMAADINIVGVMCHDAANYLRVKYPTKYGIGEYSTFVHIDIRPKKARWHE